MIFEYSQDKKAQEVIREIKHRRIRSIVAIAALNVCFAIAAVAIIVGFLHETGAKSVYLYRRLLVLAGAYLLSCLVLRLILKAGNNKYSLSVFRMRRPDCLLNASIYTYTFLDGSTVMKMFYPVKRERGMATQLNNIAVAFCEKGDLEKAEEVVTYLETEFSIKTKAAEPWKKFAILHIKALIFFDEGKKEEFKKCCSELRKAAHSFVDASRLLTKLDIMSAVLDDDAARIDKACDELAKSKDISDQVFAAFYRAQVMEKSNEDGYRQYYQFAAENGGELRIAQKARAKLGAKR